MKRVILLVVSLLFMVTANSEFAYARSHRPTHQPTHQPSRHPQHHPGPSYNGKPVIVVKSPKPKSVGRLPVTKYPIKHNGVYYYRNGSKFYKRVNGRFVVTVLPFGLRVPVIPAVHTIFRFKSINYYCSDGVVYQEAGNNEYVVVEPQIGMVVPELPMLNVNEVSIDGMIYFEFDGILYKQIPTVSGLQYEVIGTLSR